MAPLTDYLKRLATDPAELGSFQKNPDAAMQAAGLLPAHQAVLKTRDPKKISDAAIAEHPTPANANAPFTFMIYIVIKF